MPWSGVYAVSDWISLTRSNGTLSSSATSWVCAVKSPGSKFALAGVCGDHAIGSYRDPCVELVAARTDQNVGLLHGLLSVEIDCSRGESDNQCATGSLQEISSGDSGIFSPF